MHYITLLFLTVLLYGISAAGTYVKVTYETDFFVNNSYYIFDQHNLTIICEFKQDPLEVYWFIDDRVVYYYYSGTGIATGINKNRILSYSNTETTISLTISVQKDLDEGSVWSCEVYETSISSNRDQIKFPSVPAISPPTSVTLSAATHVIESVISPNFECIVSAIYPGKSVTEIILHVGNENYVEGVVTEQKVKADTVTITKSFTETFNRDQNGTDILCEVSWMKGTSLQETKTSGTQLLLVYYPAVSVSSPTISPSAPVLEGTNVIISCFTNSYPDPQLILYRKGVTYFIHKVTSNSLMWLLTLRDQDHQSQYYCRAEDGDMFDGWEFDVKSPEDLRIDVWFKAKSVSISADSSSEVTEGDSVSILCSADGNPYPALTLYRGYGEEKTQIYSSTRSLMYQIQIKREANGKNFYCEATLSNNTLPLQYAETSLTKYYRVKFPPLTNMMNTEASVAVSAGNMKTLTCTTGSSNPVSSMRWQKGGTEVTSGVISKIQSGEYGGEVLQSTYTFKAEKSDNGVQVICTPIWESSERQLTGDVRLDVTYSPSKPILSLSSIDAFEDETIIIECSSDDANPKPVLTIYKAGVKLADGEVGNKAIHNLQLERQMNGDSIICVANSSNKQKHNYIRTSDTETLNVLFPPQNNILNMNASAPVSAGNMKTLTCTTGSSNPVGSMRWQKGGTEVTSGVTSKIQSGEYGGVVLQSTYTFKAEKTDNGVHITCTPIWKGNEHLPKSKIELDVTYPPVITVIGPESPVEVETLLTIYCNVTLGNPESLLYLDWEFEPKYYDTQTQALPEQRENRELRIQRTVYSDAGTYRCTAGNTVGSDTAEIEIVVHYPPQIYSDHTLVYYSGLNLPVNLSLTVRSYPEIVDIESSFVWSKRTSGNITSFRIHAEVFVTQLNIASVVPTDYGEYTVTVDNGIKGPAIFSIELRQRGPPEAPRMVHIISLAAESALVSWVVGVNGGSEQTFTIEFKKVESKVGNYITIPYVYPITDSVIEATIYGLTPNTEYQARVKSKNHFDGGSETSSIYVSFTTREKPIVSQRDLTMERTETSAKLRWVYEITDDYTTLFIEQCNAINCTQHNVTGNMEPMLEIPLIAGKTLYLVIYQDGLEAYRSEPFGTVVEEDATTIPITSGGSSRGGIIGGFIAVTLVVATVLFGIIWIFRRRKAQQDSNNETGGHISEIPIYMNVIPTAEEKAYQDLEKMEHNEKCLYQQLSRIRLSEQLNQTEIKVYEEIKKTMHIITYKEDDLIDFSDVIYEGHYCMSQKASLSTETGRVSVIVKSCHAKARLCQAQYLFNQVKCLEMVGKHKGIVEAYSLGLSVSGPLNIKLVTKYYPCGNLTMYLGKQLCKPDNQTGLLHKLSLEITQALVYLETLTPEILHFCLCAEHVLIDDTGSCRLTGFDFKDHVLQREMEEEEEGIYGALEWKAPETIEDCKAHTKFADVWSFGVLLYQSYTKGRKPYEGMIDDEIKAFVRSGSVLPCPDGCPTKMYGVMQKCWAYSSDMRPAFHSLLAQIKAIQPTGSRVDQVESSTEYEPMVFS